MSSSRRLRPAALGAALAAWLAVPSLARAQTPAKALTAAPSPRDEGTSVSGCVSLRAAAERERDRRHHRGPLAPGEPLADGKALGVALAEAFTLAADVGLGVASAIAPNVGLRVGTGHTEFQLSWALSLPFGPDTRCRLYGTSVYRGQARHRALLEPGLLIGPQVGGFLRPGYRFLLGTDTIGYGVGLGTTIERMPDSPWRASISPELFVHRGACCLSGYVTLALRYDRFLAGRDRDVWSLSLGVSAF